MLSTHLITSSLLYISLKRIYRSMFTYQNERKIFMICVVCEYLLLAAGMVRLLFYNSENRTTFLLEIIQISVNSLYHLNLCMRTFLIFYISKSLLWSVRMYFLLSVERKEKLNFTALFRSE